MKHYITEEGSPERISVDVGREMGPVDIVRVLGEIRESLTPQFFGMKKGGSISSDVIHRKGRLYFSCCDGNFYCLNAGTGREIWRFAAGDVMPAFGMDDEAIYASCFDHRLYALTLDGRLKWKFTASGKLGNNPCISGGRVYFSCEDGNLYCVEKERGRLLWKFATASPISALPSLHGGRVFFGNFDGNFYALDAETGRPVWKFLCNSPNGGCDIHEGTILLPCTDRTLYALSLDGRLKWTYRSSVNLAPNLRSDLYRGMVFFGNRGKSVTAIDIRTGRIVWEFPTGEMTFSYNKVRDGIVYFGSCDCNFYAVDAATGREVWRFAAAGPNVGSVELSEDRIWFGSWDCHVYCLERKTGRLLWKFQTSMSNMSYYETDTRADRQEMTMTIRPPEGSREKERPEDEVTIADYGEFSGAYIDTTKTDYLGIKKQGYVK